MIRRRGLLGRKPDEPIEFVDAEVKRICVEQWGGTDGGVAAASDRVGNKKVRGKTGEITYRQAASVRVIQGQFQDNATIEYFDELQYFTSLERLGYAGAFAGNKGSFKNCTNLKHITLPNSLKYLSPGYNYNEGTFYNCSSLTDIYLPDSIVSSCEALFRGCKNLQTIRWSSNLRHIPDNNYRGYMFSDCNALQSITNLHIPQTINGTTISTIGSREFAGCVSLDFESFIDFGSITNIEGEAFGWTGHSSYTPLPPIILAEATSLGSYIFNGDTKVPKLYLHKYSNNNFTWYTNAINSLLDIHNNINTTFYPSTKTSVTLVLRCDNPSTTIYDYRVAFVNKIYVKQSELDNYKANNSNVASKTFVIGGPEWTTQFGSSNIWADYPDGINPYAYDAEVEYLQGNGTPYINTGIYGTPDLYTQLVFQSLNVGVGKAIFGAFNGNSSYYLYQSGGTPPYWQTGFGAVANTNTKTDTNKHIIEYENYKIRLDGTQVSSYSTVFTTTPETLLLYNIHKADGTLYSAEGLNIYSCKMIKDGVTVRDYIPVRKDGVGYLYDKVSGELFGNANSEGAFICGPDV